MPNRVRRGSAAWCALGYAANVYIALWASQVQAHFVMPPAKPHVEDCALSVPIADEAICGRDRFALSPTFVVSNRRGVVGGGASKIDTIIGRDWPGFSSDVPVFREFGQITTVSEFNAACDGNCRGSTYVANNGDLSEVIKSDIFQIEHGEILSDQNICGPLGRVSGNSGSFVSTQEKKDLYYCNETQYCCEPDETESIDSDSFIWWRLFWRPFMLGILTVIIATYVAWVTTYNPYGKKDGES